MLYFRLEYFIVSLIVFIASGSYAFQLGDRSTKNTFVSSRVGLLNSLTPNGEGIDDDLVCGEGFIKQTGPNGDYCVFDYESVSKKFGTDEEHLIPVSYWEGLERQNIARKKFGLKPLSPEEYVAFETQKQVIEVNQLNEAVAQAFDQFDANKDGVITLPELKLGMQDILRTELSEKSIEKVMNHFDTSGDGKLQRDEFVTLDKLRSKIDEVKKEEQLLVFDQFDANNDGVITLAELKLGMQAMLSTELSEVSVAKVMDHFDKSNDGLLQPDEFVTLDKFRNKLDAVAKEEQQLLRDEQGEGKKGIFGNFLRNLANQFEDTCETNFDCVRPEVCCDFGYKKMCCSSGRMAQNLQLEYATIPIPQNYD